MDLPTLEKAMLNCLQAHDSRYEAAEINASSPIAGGYSRLTYRFDLKIHGGDESVILQYLPVGSTGLVRVDRRVENDVLRFLTGCDAINAPTLIVSDIDGQFFDSPAYIFEAEPGQPFVDVCRGTSEARYGSLNKVIADVCARVQSIDIDDLPESMERPASWDHYLDSQIEMFKEVEAHSQYSRPFLRYLARWLDENRPPEAPLSLVHGDLQVSNMIAITDNTKEAVLVDWELAHIGDPREDLGWLTMVCGTIPPNLMAADPDAFYQTYRSLTGLSEAVINPATTAYFLIISSIRTHYGMLQSSDALAKSEAQPQSVLAAYYMNITSYQHMNWMNSIAVVETMKRGQQ